MHKEKARAFFIQGMSQVRETKDQALLAYLLGFGCHYLLIPPAILCKRDARQRGGFPTVFWKSSLTACLWKKQGKTLIPIILPYASRQRSEMQKRNPQGLSLVKTGDILLSLKLMKWITNQLVCDDGGARRARLARISSLGAIKAQSALIDHYMMVHPAGGSKELVEELNRLFEEEVKRRLGNCLSYISFPRRIIRYQIGGI